eukprot:scaffold6790_cov69-Phaeocystis_antarctica.AAC.1
MRLSSAGSHRRAGARATKPASPMVVLLRESHSSRGRAPRPRAAASAEAPRPRAQPRHQPLHAVEASGAHYAFVEHGAQLPQQRQVGSGEVIEVPVDSVRLAQLPAALHARLEAQCCGRLVISPQLLQQRLRQLPQLEAGTAQGHGDAGIEHVAQLGEDDARLVTAQRRERHRRARPRPRVLACGQGQQGTQSTTG